ncbi:uncharacterized protein LOC106719018 [Papilio machaon]|uniref:uncharacterized protein LOC106719018 n=1 Tax=Papilio machaon TaxID=76193 RepID=UPI001E665247|nr:uncharacterized protein LOC106719018 [Papilio machaon]
MASFKRILPQEGTAGPSSGESLPEVILTNKVSMTSGRPSYSGGPKDCLGYTTTTARTTVNEHASDLDKTTGRGQEVQEGGSGEAGIDLDTELMLSEDSVSASMSEGSRRANPMTRKRRGRPPTSRTYAGLAKAKHLLVEAEQREEEQSRAEAEVVAARAKARAHKLSEMLSDEEDEGFQAAGSLGKIIKENVEVIRKVASTSKNLKGGYVKALRDAAEVITKSTKVLQSRCVTEETKGLQAANARLQAEVAQLRKEVADMKERLLTPKERTEPPQHTDNEELIRTILCQVGNMVNARFEALEDRLLPEKRIRPPLAADSRPESVVHRAREVARQEKSGPAPGKASGKAQAKASGNASGKAPTKSPKGKTTEPQARPQPPAAEHAAPQQPAELPWNEVVKKGLNRKRKERPRVFTNSERRRGPRPPAVNVPKTAAVVVTITPEGFASGLTYDTVIAEAKAKIKLQDVGITTGVRFRVCATGARRFEVVGTENGPQADALAARLSQIFDGGLVRVSRPAKTTEIRISGLDDSMTVEEVLAAVAQTGDCAKENLRCSGVVRDRFGVGHAWVECPVATAKQVVAAGRLTMSWVTANVRLLEPKPLRCYRCLQKGHVRAQCNSDVDRSNQCFRCGAEGHKFKECTSNPHCTVCAAAKKPADHRVGGKGCSTPAPKITRGIPTRPPPPAHQEPAEANINHCLRAQDLLLQSVAEWSVQVAVVSEPYLIPNRDEWVGDVEEVVALFVPRSSSSLSIDGVQKGRGYVGATIGGTLVVGVYCAPSKSLPEFEHLLDQVGALVRRGRPSSVLVMGDFNARSSVWGDTVTSPRGAVLEEWALTLGLGLLNRGSRPTCVRPQGKSIVDLSFASPATARRVYGWEVVEGVESLSDHHYIRFTLLETPTVPAHQGPESPHRDTPRWVVRRLNPDLLREAAQVETWSPGMSIPDVDQRAAALRASMSRVCDCSMPRQGPIPKKRQVYWWSAEIAELRVVSVSARRQYQRYRRRRHRDPTTEARLQSTYRDARRNLCRAISEAKDRAREEMIESLNQDPWGRPYLLVRGKLRQRTPPLTRSLQPHLVQEVVTTLFPCREAHTPPFRIPRNENPDTVEDVPPITSGEFGAAIRRLRAKRTAPGPDGIPGRAWALAADAYEDTMVALMNECLASGRFPLLWKIGILVLLKKEGRSPDSPAGYRPIILLDEVAKIFERIIANRLQKHLVTVGPDLNANQFGFRSGRSTINAILRVKRIAEEAVARGEVVLAVSLDIANAFNTLPWSVIMEALRYHQVPEYLCRILRDYLSDRSISYQSRNGWRSHTVTCGVPQGSVLGPLLWNVGYDWVLRGSLIRGVEVTCYADDTLVTARAPTHWESARVGTAGVAQVVSRIRALGLEVALHKSEALYFHGPRRKPPPGSQITVGGVNIKVESHMKYLGLMLDGRWSFEGHFRTLGPKLLRTAAALGSLLPNIGGPRAACRRLFLGVVSSMALYGAPVWSGALSKRTVDILHRPQRSLAIRVIRGYRTISFEAACALAGSPPWVLQAEVLAAVHSWRERRTLVGGAPPPRVEVDRYRDERQEEAMARWQCRLRQSKYGSRTIEAIGPVLTSWVRRAHGMVTFRLAQVLSGHGCFGSYLCRIGREPSAVCHHCVGCLDDTAQHTLADCQAWSAQRQDLMAVVGEDLSLPAIVEAMVGSHDAWHAVQGFCEEVMRLKEDAERAREASTIYNGSLVEDVSKRDSPDSVATFVAIVTTTTLCHQYHNYIEDVEMLNVPGAAKPQTPGAFISHGLFKCCIHDTCFLYSLVLVVFALVDLGGGTTTPQTQTESESPSQEREGRSSSLPSLTSS